MKESLFDYLLSFRIEKSLPLLMESLLIIRKFSVNGWDVRPVSIRGIRSDL